MTQYLKIDPCGPVIARDGRPFSLGQRMVSLPWPYPSVLAGSLRTMLGKELPGGFSPENLEKLKAATVAGPLPVLGKELYFPAPQDLLIDDDTDTLYPLRPMTPEAGGCNLPERLQPVLAEALETEFKPTPPPAFWSCTKMAEWLQSPDGSGFEVPKVPKDTEGGFWDGPVQDARMHVTIAPATGSAEEGMLYRTVGLALEDKFSLTARVEAGALSDKLTSLKALHPFGGRRRLAKWSAEELAGAWACPTGLADTVGESPYLRLVLATPALFEQGWRPGWIGKNLEGTLPGTGVEVTLIGVCNERWRPISGWDLVARGPKAVRRLVPAGSVYFLKLDKPLGADAVQKLWLQSVCDEDQDCKDGFGLAIWGVWNPCKQEGAG
jgi:CRISPR-associated protein Cmr3